MKNELFIIGEIGINHNGDLDIAKQLINVAKNCGANAVKFQKRDIDSVYTKEYLNSPRESPWGNTQRDQKEGLEFGEEEYRKIDDYCRLKGIEWFASAWDLKSQEFLNKFDLKYNKIASAMLTDLDLLTFIAKERKYTFISTGMSTLKEIETALKIFIKYKCPFELMHCNSSYPMKNEEANLLTIPFLKHVFNCKVGYSGHEKGLQVSLGAVALGIDSLERHITLDRTMYGSDQSASLEPHAFEKLIRDARIIKSALGEETKKIWDSELKVRKKLRGV